VALIRRFLWLPCALLLVGWASILACAQQGTNSELGGLLGAVAVKEEIPVPRGEQGNGIQGPAPVAVVHNDQPSLEWKVEGELGFFIAYAHLGDEDALEFTVSDWTRKPHTDGHLYTTPQRIIWHPDPDAGQGHAPFSFAKSEATFPADSYNYFRADGQKFNFEPLIESRIGDAHQYLDTQTYCKERGLHLNACLALTENPRDTLLYWYHLAATDFPSTFRKFTALTCNLSVPLPEAQAAAIRGTEANGDSKAKAGKLYDALQDYEAALQALPAQWAPRDIEQRLEEKAIKLVLRMDPRPAIPQEAMQHLAYAETAFQEAKGPADLDNAIQELHQALRLAPWWGDAYKNLGLLFEKENRYEDAARNLELYLLATPNGPDAQSVQMKIYSLQYKAKQQATTN
jgi:tetratricopeptide (TPR) repeat protein